MEGKVPDCGYEGIWSFKNKRDAIRKFTESYDTAYGSIKIWDKVVEHQIGYRAEFARIIQICDVNMPTKSRKERNEMLETLRLNYKL